MAESSEPQKIKLTVKTPKDKKDVEVPEEASIKEVLIINKYFNEAQNWLFYLILFTS